LAKASASTSTRSGIAIEKTAPRVGREPDIIGLDSTTLRLLFIAGCQQRDNCDLIPGCYYALDECIQAVKMRALFDVFRGQRGEFARNAAQKHIRACRRTWP
jgi:hypothetical protein